MANAIVSITWVFEFLINKKESRSDCRQNVPKTVSNCWIESVLHRFYNGDVRYSWIRPDFLFHLSDALQQRSQEQWDFHKDGKIDSVPQTRSYVK